MQPVCGIVQHAFADGVGGGYMTSKLYPRTLATLLARLVHVVRSVCGALEG
jgi:hypothetical protein